MRQAGEASRGRRIKSDASRGNSSKAMRQEAGTERRQCITEIFDTFY
jgi:hypothetical protein